jgi:CDP-diacylglycerol--serine O-phosphatidyltransferase
MRVKTNWVPSAFTMANLFCGYYSVILSANGKFMYAAWLIVAAAVMDALDGKIARFAKADSPFGVEYDSLADVVSFGFAPSFLAYKVEFIEWGTIGLLISFGPLVFGSIRLARFNIKLKGLSKDFFEGLPIPAAAVSIATFVVFNYHFWEYLRFVKMFLFIVLAVSFLMVTSIRYETLPSFTLQSGIANRVKFLFVLLGIIIIAVFPQETFFPISVIYILSGPVRGAWLILRSGQKIKKKKRNSNNESSD